MRTRISMLITLLALFLLPSHQAIASTQNSGFLNRSDWYSLARGIGNQGCSNSDKDYSRPTLYLQTPAMSGSDVTYLQSRLLDLGYALPVSGADGWFGTETDAAVREFQRRNGLEADGAVGPVTWACLNNPNAARANSQSQPPAPSSRPSVCGRYILHITSQPGFGDWESYFFSTSSENYGFSKAAFSEGYYRLYDPVFSQQYSTFLDGTSIEYFITGWSDYEKLNGYQDCNQQSSQQPPQLPPQQPAQNPPARSLTPADVRITDFTLADTLTDFSFLAPPTILKPNGLWIQITNVGESTFSPPNGRGDYILQVILKQPGGKLEEYDYVSGEPLSLAPLGNMDGGASINVLIGNLFFFTPVDNGELEVFFSPNTNLGMENSVLSKAITVKDQTDSYNRCAGTVAGAVIKVVKLACPTCSAAMRVPDLAARAVKCGADGACLGKETAKWAVGLLFGRLGDAGQFLSLAADAVYALREGNIPCMKVSDFLNAYLREVIRTNVHVNGVITESPVYPLVTNAAGQRVGFLENGEIVNEIPDSQVLIVGEERFVLFPGVGDATVQVAGYADGTMNLYTTLTKGTGWGMAVRYSNVPVTQGMLGTLNSTDEAHILQIDENGDLVADRSVSPDEVTLVTQDGEYMQLLEETIPEVLPAQPEETDSQPPRGICGSTAGIFALPLVAVLWIRKNRAHRDPS